MFVLDTNVLSETMRSTPAPQVANWLRTQSMAVLFTTSICQAEILSGIALVPEGRRRYGLAAVARTIFEQDFEGRVLPFDSAAATTYASLVAARRKAGRPIATVDLIVASVALSQGAAVVTRDIGGFDECGLTLINPWDAS